MEKRQQKATATKLAGIKAIKAEYAAFTSHTTIEARFPVADPAKVISPHTAGPTAPSSDPAKTEVPSEMTPVEPAGPLQVVEKAHVPAPLGEPRKLQVKTVTSSGGRSGSLHRVTDADFCERKATEFEEASEPARWPLPVGQIMGTEGPGCDVLSFLSEEAREAFRLGPIRDMKTVARFIEVKGRGNAAATIELRGNELSAAERYGERYFLYRLFEAEDGTFELTVLQNPLMHKEALQPAVHVGMEKAEATLRFSLIGGLKKEAAS